MERARNASRECFSCSAETAHLLHAKRDLGGGWKCDSAVGLACSAPSGARCAVCPISQEQLLVYTGRRCVRPWGRCTGPVVEREPRGLQRAARPEAALCSPR